MNKLQTLQFYLDLLTYLTQMSADAAQNEPELIVRDYNKRKDVLYARKAMKFLKDNYIEIDQYLEHGIILIPETKTEELKVLYRNAKSTAEQERSNAEYCFKHSGNPLDPNGRLDQGKASALSAILSDMQIILGISEELPYDVESINEQCA